MVDFQMKFELYILTIILVCLCKLSDTDNENLSFEVQHIPNICINLLFYLPVIEKLEPFYLSPDLYEPTCITSNSV